MRTSAPSITGDMLWPLLVMWLGFTLFFIAVALQRARTETLERERRSAWIRELS